MLNNLVTVIIVNYNGSEVLENCVRSIFSSSYSPLEVIIVDNSPFDGSAEKISRQYDIFLLNSIQNIGYSAGNNKGLMKAKGEYILILNNDTEIHPRAIEELVLESRRSPNRILQPKIVKMNDRKILNSTGILIHIAGFGLLRGCGDQDSKENYLSPQICAPHGACFFFPKKIIGDFGLFDPNFFAFCEDTDLGWRALLKGTKTKFVPSAIVFHKWGHTYNKSNLSTKIYLAERNRLIMILTNYQVSTIVLSLPIFLLAELSTSVYCTGHGIFQSKIHGYSDLFRMRSYLNQRRQQIQSSRKVNDSEIMEFFILDFTHEYYGKFNNVLNRLFSFFGRFLSFLNIKSKV